MRVSLIFQVAGVGLIASFVCTALRSYGREDQAQMVSLVSMITVLFMILSLTSDLLRELFSLMSVLGLSF